MDIRLRALRVAGAARAARERHRVANRFGRRTIGIVKAAGALPRTQNAARGSFGTIVIAFALHALAGGVVANWRRRQALARVGAAHARARRVVAEGREQRAFRSGRARTSTLVVRRPTRAGGRGAIGVRAAPLTLACDAKALIGRPRRAIRVRHALDAAAHGIAFLVAARILSAGAAEYVGLRRPRVVHVAARQPDDQRQRDEGQTCPLTEFPHERKRIPLRRRRPLCRLICPERAPPATDCGVDCGAGWAPPYVRYSVFR